MTTQVRPAIIKAPSVLGLRPTGVEQLPDALLEAGLADRLPARVAGTVDPPPYDPRRDSGSGFLNPEAIAGYSSHLADAVDSCRDAGEFPIVLGGDCSIVLGTLLSMRRRGRYGLLFLDGHADFYQPEANVNGEAASSDLALATGRGPDVLTRLETVHPLVHDQDVVVVGHRDAEEAADYGSQPLPAEIHAYDLATLRRSGANPVAQAATAHLTRPELDGFWIHFDVDVLDDAVMPAVDYRIPDGLSWEEARDLLTPAIATGRAAGIDVTIFNPKLDATGEIAHSLVDFLVAVLSPGRTTHG